MSRLVWPIIFSQARSSRGFELRTRTLDTELWTLHKPSHYSLRFMRYINEHEHVIPLIKEEDSFRKGTATSPQKTSIVGELWHTISFHKPDPSFTSSKDLSRGGESEAKHPECNSIVEFSSRPLSHQEGSGHRAHLSPGAHSVLPPSSFCESEALQVLYDTGNIFHVVNKIPLWMKGRSKILVQLH